MNEKKGDNSLPQGLDRREDDRRKVHIDPADLPFPDRREEEDRRTVSTEEQEEILKRIKARGKAG